MKDSEDVMETLEVTSLAELKDKTEQIATSNKANAKAALEGDRDRELGQVGEPHERRPAADPSRTRRR